MTYSNGKMQRANSNSKFLFFFMPLPHKFKEIMSDDRMYPTGWHHREFEGQYRPPLTPEERAAKEAKRLARQENDNRLEALLRQLAGSPSQHQ